MPYPDSEYPSILRGRSKRESQRLLAAAPELLAAAKGALEFLEGDFAAGKPDTPLRRLESVIAKAEGRE